MNRDHSRHVSVSSGLAFYCRVPGGSSEQVSSTGFYLAPSLSAVPPVSKESASRDASLRSFRAKHRSASDSLPPVPPPTPQLSAQTAADYYRDDEPRSRRAVVTSASATQLKRRFVADRGAGCLTFALVTMGLCAFVWLVASGALANQADVVNRELDSAREEAAEPAVVLHLEDNSAAESSLPAKPYAGETIVNRRTRTAMTVGRGRTRTTSRWDGASKKDDMEEDDLFRTRPKAGETEGSPESEDDAYATEVSPTQDTESIQEFLRVEDHTGSKAAAITHSGGLTTHLKHGHSRKGSHNSKRRHLYPRRHIHRTTP